MTRQLPLGLQLKAPTSLDDFVYGDDSPLLELLHQQRQAHGEPLIYLHGDPGSGRTHLLLGQCTAAQAQGMQIAYLPCREIADLAPQMLEGLEQLDLVAVDDVDLLAGQSDWETALFNLFNRARDAGCRLLLSANNAASQVPFKLPDLRSRLTWGVTYRLRPLNDTQRQQLLQNLAQRRGLQMPDDVARYLVERHSRDTLSLQKLIERLDRDSLAEQRRLSIPFVRTRLD
jgi:DnaA family protein